MGRRSRLFYKKKEKRRGRGRSNVGRASGELLREGLIQEGRREGSIVPLHAAKEGDSADVLARAPEPP